MERWCYRKLTNSKVTSTTRDCDKGRPCTWINPMIVEDDVVQPYDLDIFIKWRLRFFQITPTQLKSIFNG
jgi:hypothetical protein